MRQDNLHLLFTEWQCLNKEREATYRNERWDIDRKMVNLEEIINREIVNHPEAREEYKEIIENFLTYEEE